MKDLSIPADLNAHAMWSPPQDARGRDRSADVTRVVFVTERRRRKIAMWLPILPLGVAVLAVTANLPFVGYAAGIVAVTALASMAIHRSGRAGFYRLTPDGALGEYLGRRPPDLSGLKRTRVRTTS